MAQRVSSSSLCLGMAQSYRELKLHITTTPTTSLMFATELKTLRAMPEFPDPVEPIKENNYNYGKRQHNEKLHRRFKLFW